MRYNGEVRVAALVLLMGCDRVLGLSSVTPIADSTPTGTPSLVHQTTGQGSGTNLTVAFGEAVQAQDVLVLVGGSEKGLMQPTGGGVASWQLAANAFYSPDAEIWFGVTDGSSNTITVTTSVASTLWADVTEWSGVATIQAFDDGMGTGSGDTAGSGTASLTVTTSTTPDLLVFGISYYTSIGNPSGSWMPLQPTFIAGVSQHTWYQIASATGAQTVQFAYAGGFDAALAALHAGP